MSYFLFLILTEVIITFVFTAFAVRTKEWYFLSPSILFLFTMLTHVLFGTTLEKFVLNKITNGRFFTSCDYYTKRYVFKNPFKKFEYLKFSGVIEEKISDMGDFSKCFEALGLNVSCVCNGNNVNIEIGDDSINFEVENKGVLIENLEIWEKEKLRICSKERFSLHVIDKNTLVKKLISEKLVLACGRVVVIGERLKDIWAIFSGLLVLIGAALTFIFISILEWNKLYSMIPVVAALIVFLITIWIFYFGRKYSNFMRSWRHKSLSKNYTILRKATEMNMDEREIWCNLLSSNLVFSPEIVYSIGNIQDRISFYSNYEIVNDMRGVNPTETVGFNMGNYIRSQLSVGETEEGRRILLKIWNGNNRLIEPVATFSYAYNENKYIRMVTALSLMLGNSFVNQFNSNENFIHCERIWETLDKIDISDDRIYKYYNKSWSKDFYCGEKVNLDLDNESFCSYEVIKHFLKEKCDLAIIHNKNFFSGNINWEILKACSISTYLKKSMFTPEVKNSQFKMYVSDFNFIKELCGLGKIKGSEKRAKTVHLIKCMSEENEVIVTNVTNKALNEMIDESLSKVNFDEVNEKIKEKDQKILIEVNDVAKGNVEKIEIDLISVLHKSETIDILEKEKSLLLSNKSNERRLNNIESSTTKRIKAIANIQIEEKELELAMEEKEIEERKQILSSNITLDDQASKNETKRMKKKIENKKEKERIIIEQCDTKIERRRRNIAVLRNIIEINELDEKDKEALELNDKIQTLLSKYKVGPQMKSEKRCEFLINMLGIKIKSEMGLKSIIKNVYLKNLAENKKKEALFSITNSSNPILLKQVEENIPIAFRKVYRSLLANISKKDLMKNLSLIFKTSMGNSSKKANNFCLNKNSINLIRGKKVEKTLNNNRVKNQSRTYKVQRIINEKKKEFIKGFCDKKYGELGVIIGKSNFSFVERKIYNMFIYYLEMETYNGFLKKKKVTDLKDGYDIVNRFLELKEELNLEGENVESEKERKKREKKEKKERKKN